MPSFPKYKTIAFILVILGLAVSITGCPSEESRSEPVKKIQIGVSVADGENLNTQVIRKTMEKRLKEDGVSLIWLDAANDAVKQQENVAALLERKVDVAVLQPVDENMAVSLVQQLKQEKVKVITLGKMPPNTPLDGHIRPDFTIAGNLQAQFVLDTLAQGRTPSGNVQGGQQVGQPGNRQAGNQDGSQGGQQGSTGVQQGSTGGTLVQAGEVPLNSSVLLLRGPQGDKVSDEISTANLSVLETNPAIQVKVREVPGGNSTLIKSKTVEFLTEESIMPGFVLTNEPQAGDAVLEFLQQNGMNSRVVTVGLGGGKNAAVALAAGQHNAEVDIMPEVIANQAYDAAVAVAKGEHWPYDRLADNGDFQVPLRLTPVRLVKQENVFLLEERWGSLAGQDTGGAGGDGSSGQDGQSGQDDPQNSQSSGGEQSSGGGGQTGQGGMTTTVIIKTMEGKTYEMHIDGVVKSIESSQEGATGGTGGGTGGQGGGGGS